MATLLKTPLLDVYVTIWAWLNEAKKLGHWVGRHILVSFGHCYWIFSWSTYGFEIIGKV